MERKDIIDLFLKIFALVGALFSFFYGIHEYEKINQDESAKTFWAQQFPIYKDLCATAAMIATSSDSVSLSKANNEFWRMYYGEAQMVMDKEVHNKLSIFAKSLIMVERGEKKNYELFDEATQLSTACRMSLSKSWRIPLSNLKED